MIRCGDAGPKTAAPSAQCLGKHIFHCALVSHQSDWFHAQAWKYSAEQEAPLRAVTSNLCEAGEYAQVSFLTVEPDELVVTCVRKAERDDVLIVHFYNMSEQVTSGYLTCYRPISEKLFCFSGNIIAQLQTALPVA